MSSAVRTTPPPRTVGNSTMYAYQIASPFGIDALVQVERPLPRVGRGQVLVRTCAVALNYRDVMIVNGVWRAPGPRVPVSDGMGEVVEVGAGVTGLALGDRVVGSFYPRWIEGAPSPEKLREPLGGVAADGVLAEYVRFDARALLPVPAHLSDEEAATLPCAGVAAWHAVEGHARVRPGETVLVQGTGGVSLFALQFARLAGARVLVTSSSDEKLRRARELGAAAGINYRTSPDWDERVLELTGGRGVDHVVEVAGGENLNRSLRALRPGGTISVVGFLGGTAAPVDTFQIAMKSARLYGIDVGSREMFAAMTAAMAEHRLRPIVDRVFRRDQVHAALRYLASGAHFGKVCVRL